MEKIHHAQAGAERRRFERIPLNLKISFRCLDKDYISDIKDDLAEDLGAGGVAIRSMYEMKQGQLLMLSLHLPSEDMEEENAKNDDDHESEKVVNIFSTVAWCKLMKTGEFMIGVQFLDLDPDERMDLKEFLVEYKLDQPDSSLYT